MRMIRMAAIFLLGVAFGTGGISLHQEARRADALDVGLARYANASEQNRKNLKLLAEWLLPVVPGDLSVPATEIQSTLWSYMPDQSGYAEVLLLGVETQVRDAYLRAQEQGLVDENSTYNLRDLILSAQAAAQ